MLNVVSLDSKLGQESERPLRMLHFILEGFSVAVIMHKSTVIRRNGEFREKVPVPVWDKKSYLNCDRLFHSEKWELVVGNEMAVAEIKIIDTLFDNPIVCN